MQTAREEFKNGKRHAIDANHGAIDAIDANHGATTRCKSVTSTSSIRPSTMKASSLLSKVVESNDTISKTFGFCVITRERAALAPRLHTGVNTPHLPLPS